MSRFLEKSMSGKETFTKEQSYATRPTGDVFGEMIHTLRSRLESNTGDSWSSIAEDELMMTVESEVKVVVQKSSGSQEEGFMLDVSVESMSSPNVDRIRSTFEIVESAIHDVFDIQETTY